MFHQTKSCTYPDSMKEQISTAYWHEKLKQLGIIVIIPSYNNGKTLADVIESVRFYAPDILVVNDGSTDETAEILSRESKIHPHPFLSLGNPLEISLLKYSPPLEAKYLHTHDHTDHLQF